MMLYCDVDEILCAFHCTFVTVCQMLFALLILGKQLVLDENRLTSSQKAIKLTFSINA